MSTIIQAIQLLTLKYLLKVKLKEVDAKKCNSVSNFNNMYLISPDFGVMLYLYMIVNHEKS